MTVPRVEGEKERIHEVVKTKSRLDTIVTRKRGNVKFRDRLQKPAIGNGRLLKIPHVVLSSESTGKVHESFFLCRFPIRNFVHSVPFLTLS